MAHIPVEAHWRDSARPVRFFIWDAKAAFPFIFFLLYASWWTFGFALGAMIFFSILNRYGFTIAVFGRWLRNVVAGNRKPVKPWWLE